MNQLQWFYQRGHFALWRRWLLGSSPRRVLILAFHRITNDPVWEDLYNIRPRDLDALLGLLKQDGFCFVTLEQVFSGEKLPRKAVCVTCDDGFRDNLTEGAPVFRKHGVPFTVFVPTGFAARRHVSLEAMAEFMRTHEDWKSPAVTPAEKEKDPAAAVNRAIAPARNGGTLDEILAAKQAFMDCNGTDLRQEMDRLYLSQADLRVLAAEPLCTLGAHGEHHVQMSRMNPAQLRENTELCKLRLEQMTGKPCRYLAFPFGGMADNYFREFRAADRAGFEGCLMFFAGIASEKIVKNGHMIPRQDLSSLQTPEENLQICRRLWKSEESHA